MAGSNPTLYGYVFDTNTQIDPLGLDNIIFTSSDGLTLEVKNIHDLSHLSDKDITKLYHANNNPKGFGQSPKNANGEVIVLHHQKQSHAGPIIEMPNSGHVRGIGNKKMHPFFPNPHPTNPVDRDLFDKWRKEYWKSRAETEMKRRGLSCH